MAGRGRQPARGSAQAFIPSSLDARTLSDGAILGMSRAEIRRKFDPDRRVRRSGAVFGHAGQAVLERHVCPAALCSRGAFGARNPRRRRGVGGRRDVEFQKKCLGKMTEVAGAGRTVLFVSHNMESIRRICSTGLLLSAGRVELIAGVDRCIESYLSNRYAPTELTGSNSRQKARTDRASFALRY